MTPPHLPPPPSGAAGGVDNEEQERRRRWPEGGEELIYTAAAPVQVGLYKRGASQEKLGSGRPPGALLLRRGVRGADSLKIHL